MNDPLFWLYADNYRTFNIDVARKLKSIHAAILLAELASKHRYHRDRNELLNDPKHGDGWFYYKQEDLEERTYLSRKNQDTTIDILITFGLIEKKVIGMPSKRYFRLNHKALQSLFFVQSDQPSLPEPDNQPCMEETNSDVRAGQAAHIIDNPKDEQHDNQHTQEEEAVASCVGVKLTPRQKGTNPRAQGTNPRAKDKSHLNCYGSYVMLSAEEYQSFCDQYGEATLKILIDEMNDYCAASRTKGYADYAAAIRQWMRKREGTGVQTKKERKFAPCSDDQKAYEALIRGRANAL